MKWLADENFDNDILRGLYRREPGIDIVRAQDIDAVMGQDDVLLLAWATRNGRVVLTHDLSTMVPAMDEQLRRHKHCTPILMVPDKLAVGEVIDDILLLEDYGADEDWSAGLIYLPLR